MVIYGKRVCYYAMESRPELIKKVILSKKLPDAEFRKIAALGKKIEIVDNKKAQALSRGGNHQGYFLELEDIGYAQFESIKHQPFLLVLCGVTDVGNIGSIARSAYALGVDGIILCSVASVNMPGIIRASSGAALRIPIVLEQSAHDVINELRQIGSMLMGADMKGESALMLGEGSEAAKPAERVALFMGSEGQGLEPKLLKKMHRTVSVQMRREFESLNVAVAAAILIDRIGEWKNRLRSS